jgi:hypothetical protein
MHTVLWFSMVRCCCDAAQRMHVDPWEVRQGCIIGCVVALQPAPASWPVAHGFSGDYWQLLKATAPAWQRPVCHGRAHSVHCWGAMAVAGVAAPAAEGRRLLAAVQRVLPARCGGGRPGYGVALEGRPLGCCSAGAWPQSDGQDCC